MRSETLSNILAGTAPANVGVVWFPVSILVFFPGDGELRRIVYVINEPVCRYVFIRPGHIGQSHCGSTPAFRPKYLIGGVVRVKQEKFFGIAIVSNKVVGDHTLLSFGEHSPSH